MKKEVCEVCLSLELYQNLMDTEEGFFHSDCLQDVMELGKRTRRLERVGRYGYLFATQTGFKRTVKGLRDKYYNPLAIARACRPKSGKAITIMIPIGLRLAALVEARRKGGFAFN